MKRPFVVLLVLVGLLHLGSLGGCSDECKQLADMACEKAGEQSDICKKDRSRAENASPDDKRACKRVLDVTQYFTAK